MSINGIRGAQLAYSNKPEQATKPETKIREEAVHVQAEHEITPIKIDDITAKNLQKENGNEQSGKNANAEAIKRAINELNKSNPNSVVQFGVHEATHRMTIKILDKDTRKVIKEFPAEKTLDLIAKAWELAGFMVDEIR